MDHVHDLRSHLLPDRASRRPRLRDRRGMGSGCRRSPRHRIAAGCRLCPAPEIGSCPQKTRCSANSWRPARCPRWRGRHDGRTGLAEDGDDVGGPVLQAAGAEFRDRAAPPDAVGAVLLDTREPRQEVLVPGVGVGDQVSREQGGQPGGDGVFAAGADGLQERQPAVRGPGDQHVRRAGRRLVLLLRVRFFLTPAMPGPAGRSCPAPTASPQPPRRPALPRNRGTPQAVPRSSSRPGRGPAAGLSPGDRAARPACGFSCAPAPTAAAPAAPLSPRSAL